MKHESMKQGPTKQGKTIGVFNVKGGEGKTTTVFNLAAALAEKDQRVLMIDIDAQGSLTVKCGYDLFSLKKTLYHALLGELELQEILQPTPLHPNIFLAPTDLGIASAERKLFSHNPAWGYALERTLAPVRHEYDYVLIDCPGASLVLTTNAIISSSEILCPMQCADMSMNVYPLVENDVQELAEHRKVTIPIYILRTMLDPTVHAKDASEAIKAALADQVMQTVIPRRTVIRDAMSMKQSILQHSPDTDIAESFRQLAEEVMTHA